jgi:eukaryotic-like serine/threonine-protein kinase
MQVPDRIGRYCILGELATGGMAQILLGKYEGPSAFERPIVIKRILSHLADDPDFVAMFIDEARITSRIRHPNVAQVHELAREGKELYLVMEYLEGESVAAALRRVIELGRTFDPRLAAYVVAEACSGLHAAHELRDDQDRLVGLVHRDISPQNVFLGYDGSVRVLDFGIAMAEGREVQTRTGGLKGKVPYMSPEQCRGDPLDRRSDVFALGILLWELCALRRLFKRKSELLVLKAITEEPVTPLSSVASGCPAGLEAICLRALARSPEDRYPTAAAMRADLLSVLRELEAAGDGRDDLASLMHELFRARRDEKREMLRRVGKGELPTVVPRAEPETTTEVPTLVESQTLLRMLSATDSPAVRVRRRASRFVAGIALATATVIALVAARMRPGGSDAAAQPTAATREASLPPTLAAQAATMAPPSASASSLGGAVAAPSSMVRFDTTPPGATVVVDGVELGRTPVDAPVHAGGETIAFRMTLPGFESVSGSLVPDRDQHIARSLVRARTGGSSSAATAGAAATSHTPNAPASATAPPAFKPWM